MTRRICGVKRARTRAKDNHTSKRKPTGPSVRAYTAEEQDVALLQLAIHNGNYEAASRASHVPSTTIRAWVVGQKGKPGPLAERYEEIVNVSKKKQNNMLSVLLNLFFHGIVRNAEHFKPRDYITGFGVIMDKFIMNDEQRGTDAGDVLDRLMSREEFRNAVLRR